jgi:hypothetical protein
MKRFCFFGGMAALSALTAFSQSAGQAEGEKKRTGEFRIPLPMVDPRAIAPGALVPLTPGQKANLAFRNTFYPQALANRLLLAGWDHLLDHPSEWPGDGEGFGMRMGNRVGWLATRNSIQLGVNVLMKTEPRYDLCICSGVKSRLWHAWRRVLVTRRDDGRETFAAAQMAGSFGTPWVAYNWYPDRFHTTGRKFQAGATDLGWRAVTNTLREFWPDIAVKLHLPLIFHRRP